MGDIIRIAKLVLVAALAAGSVAACARNGPPAPVEVKGSQHYGRSTAVASAPRAAGDIVVQRGDTLYGLARKHGVAPQELIAANRLRAPYTLQVGQRLSLPGAPPPTRVVETRPAPVETLPAGSVPPAAPAERVESAPLAPISSAPISNTSAVVAAPARPAAVAAEAPEPAPQPEAAAPARIADAPAQVPSPASLSERQIAEVEPVASAVPARAGRGFQWPVRGRVVSDFGPKGGGLHNDGINIAATRGTPIRAAESGVVVYSGNELRGFGNLVLLRHADGWMTAYGHADELTVQRGEQVRRGQVIGRVGATGNVTSPQIHFEIRRGSRPVNPREHLSSESASAE